MPNKSDLGAGAPRQPTSQSTTHAGASNLRAPITHGELRELIEEEALLRARRRGLARCTPREWAEAQAAVQRRLGL